MAQETSHMRALWNVGRRIRNVVRISWARFCSNRSWEKRFRKVFELHPEYSRPCNRDVERKHLELWRQLRADVNLRTLRVCFNVSGRADPEMVPEEVFVSEIEGSLDRYKLSEFLTNKSVYSRWFPGNIFPNTFIHNIDGLFYDDCYRLLREGDLGGVLDGLEYPVVIKPSLDSYGGRGVFFPPDRAALKKRMEGQKNYVVQELLKQHEFFMRFNKQGLNTLRVCIYRSVVTDEFHVLSVAQRMGKGGSLDNETAGGLVCFVRPDGTLNDYAVDKYGKKYFQHPDTGLKFCEKQVIPDFEDMKRLAVQVAQQIYLVRLSSLDMCMDEDGRWRVIELNVRGQTIRFSQYGGYSFFGRFTQEVIDYCKRKPWWR